MCKIHPVDIHVGHRLKAARLEQGLSQAELANSIGLTFQQIQKYERGKNRISASRLYELANILNISIMAFYDGLETADKHAPQKLEWRDYLFIERFKNIPDRKAQQAIKTLIKQISEN